MKSFEDPPKSKGKRRLSVENARNPKSSDLEVKSTQKNQYEFGLEYYSTGPNNIHQDEYLDRVSRKKQIGPYHNSVSANFVLPTASKNAGRNAPRDIMKNSISEVRREATKMLEEEYEKMNKVEENKRLLLLAARNIIQSNASNQDIQKVSKKKMAKAPKIKNAKK